MNSGIFAATLIALALSQLDLVTSRRPIIPPWFTDPMEDHTVWPGSNLTLTCSVGGSPQPVVRWRHDTVDVSDDVDTPDQTTSVLHLTDIRQSTNYTCEAYSILGKITHVVQVTVQARSSPPLHVTANVTSPSAILVRWDPPEYNDGEITGYKIWYTTRPENPFFFWERQEVDTNNNNNNVAAISGLKANETYTIIVTALSSVGQGPLSEAIRVRTVQGNKV